MTKPYTRLRATMRAAAQAEAAARAQALLAAMPDTYTPAQVAYEAYMAVLSLSFPMDFAALPATYRRAWEAAAQAAITDWWQAHDRL